MRKFKYQGGLTKLITTEIGKKNKLRFAKFIEKNLLSLLKDITKESLQIPMDVVSFSSSSDFYEQILSILSFLRYVGIPNSWLIYSDESHTSEQIHLLTNNFEFATVKVV